MNSVNFIGRTTADIEIKKSASGSSYCSFNLAINRPKSEGSEQEADYPRIVAFGKLAENAEKYVKKGSLIGVEGRVQTSKYEKDGVTNYTTEFIASRIEYLALKE